MSRPFAPTPSLCGLLIASLAAFSPAVLGDGDTAMHLAAGNWMLDHWAVLRHDPFSATLHGHDWDAHEWLAEIATALSFRLAGWSGVVLLTAAAAGLAVANLGRHLARWLAPPHVAVLLLLAILCLLPDLLARPHILALPVLEAWIAILVQARGDSRAPRLRWAPMMTVWANLHASFAFGLILAAGLGLEAVANTRDRRRAIRSWSLFLLAAAAAATLNPRGIDGLLFPLRLLQLHGLAEISEWQPTDFSSLPPLEIALFALLLVCAGRGIRIPPVRLGLLLLMLHMALQHRRHGLLLAVSGVLLLAEPLAAGLPTRIRSPRQTPSRWAAIAGCLLMGLRLATPVARQDGPGWPSAAFDRLPAAIASAPVFNDPAFGGFLMLAGVAPFIDGRAELYGDRFIGTYLAIANADPAGMNAAFRRYSIRWAILRPDNPAVRTLRLMPDWPCAFSNPTAVVFERRP